MASLLTGSVQKHMLRLTLPSIGGMLAIMIFNITDTYFVAKLGTDQLAAMGFTFAVLMMVGALTMGFSTGATSIITRAIGSNDLGKARRTVTDGLFLTIVIASVISMAGYVSIIPLFTLLGAKGDVLFHVSQYMQVWFLGVVVVIMPPLSDDCLRASGDMVRPLFVMLTCALMNVILDPMLIFGFGPIPAMGISGAALATIIARFIGMSTSLYFLHFHARLIDWKMPSLVNLFRSWRSIIYLGIPAALAQALTPLAQAFYMRVAAETGGVAAVAAMAAGIKVEAFIALFAMAYGIAIIPFVGQNYGARNFNRVVEVCGLNLRFGLLYSGITFVLFWFSADYISAIFSENPQVIALCSLYLILNSLGHSGIYLSNWMSQMFNVIGRPRSVLLLNFCRVFLYIVPLVFLGSKYYGFKGLIIGLIIGNILSGVHSQILSRLLIKEIQAE